MDFLRNKTVLFFISDLVICLLLIGLHPTSAFAEKKIIRFVSLNWPPYSGENLPQQGANVLVAKAAFAAMGYELQVDFFPWARTIMMSKEDRYLGYFSEYYAKEIENDFFFSNPIGESLLGFVERKDNPIKWETVEDLKTVKVIGTVRGYVNTKILDDLVEKREIKAEPVVRDIINLRKVAKGRIPLAVIDKSVMEYLLKNDNFLESQKNVLQFNTKLLEEKKLYLCFQKSAKGRYFLEIFNQGLNKIDVNKLNQQYFNKVNQ